jgi:hypothetical protein
MAVTTLACPNSSCTVASVSPQVGQKGFNILSGSVFQGFIFKKTIKVLRPLDIEGRTVRSYPVLLRAPPVGIPKTLALFGIMGIHDFYTQNPLNVYRLTKNSTCNDRRNYHITI